MPNSIISALTADTNPAATDLVATVDVSDTTDAASGTTKKCTLTNLNKGLPAFTGDSGSGGVKGLVPAPAAGDAAAGKFLNAAGGYSAPTGGSGGIGDVVGPASSIDNEVAIFNSTTGKLLKAPGTMRFDGNALYSTSGGTRTLGLMAGGPWQQLHISGGAVSGFGIWFTSGAGTADSSKISSIANGILIVTTSAGVGGAISTPANTQAQFTANQDNLTPAGPSRMQRWSSDASRDVTGMLIPGGNNNGQDHVIINVGAQNIVLKNDVTSTATNRFLNSTGADITLAPNEMAFTIYDSTTQRWRTNKI